MPNQHTGVDMVEAKDSYWRVLIRVKFVGTDFVWLIIPAWDSKTHVSVAKSAVPEQILQRINQGEIRFHAMVNLGVDDLDELDIKDWEIS